MLVFFKCLMCLLAGFVGDIRVLYFTSQQCPPCRQMSPTVDRLINEGYPVSKLEINSHLQLAQQCGVQSTPTTVILKGDQIAARQSGIIGYVALRNKLDQLIEVNEPKSSSADTNVVTEMPLPPTPADFSSERATGKLTPRQLAMQATVRLKVSDAGGVSFATGTVIHMHGEDALIITCGHVFRESKGKGSIAVDVGFGGNQVRTVPGELIDFDADAYDVALVTFKPGIEIQPVPIAHRASNISRGAAMFTLGCDAGDDPTFQDTRIKKRNQYDGVVKYDIVGRPVTGRSGGGLFDQDGHLIGICNAAVVEVNEGIYTGLPTIYWQLERVRLVHLFENNSPAQVAGGSRLAQANLSSANLKRNHDIEINAPPAVAVNDQHPRCSHVYTGLRRG